MANAFPETFPETKNAASANIADTAFSSVARVGFETSFSETEKVNDSSNLLAITGRDGVTVATLGDDSQRSTPKQSPSALASLAMAIEHASKAGEWAVVAALATELQRIKVE